MKRRRRREKKEEEEGRSLPSMVFLRRRLGEPSKGAGEVEGEGPFLNTYMYC